MCLVGPPPHFHPTHTQPANNAAEHFSTPLHFAVTHGFFTARSLTVTLEPFPAGTGHMIKSLESGSLDLAIGLTEGWIASLGNGTDFFKLVGTYVSTPLCWAVSTGASRTDKTSVADLRDGKLGISRFGSGSYVMGFVLADTEGWLQKDDSDKEPWTFVPLETFKNLRDAVNDGRADAFMWELFTSKRYYDSGEIKQIGTIYTPWPSWQIVAHADMVVVGQEDKTAAVRRFLEALDEGVAYFQKHKEEAVEYISTHLDYSAEDAREWMKTVEFAESCTKVQDGVVEKTVTVLKKAGVIKDDKVELPSMVATV